MQRKRGQHLSTIPTTKRTASSPRRSSEIESRLRERIVFVHYHFIEFLSQYLADGLRVFGGDLEELMIMAIVGQMHLRARLDALPEAGKGSPKSPITASISASRIADVTGIPRETVRRKLLVLEQWGWIERDTQAKWRLSMDGDLPVAHAALQELNENGVSQLACFLAKLFPVL
jgi:hypothetical protein